MKIISEINKDTRTPDKIPGSYEWWYFDAISKNGFSVVVIFYDGNPFSRRYIQSLEKDEKASPSDFPAITISFYKHGVPLFYSFEEMEPGQAEFSDVQPFGRVGGNSFSLKREADHYASSLLQSTDPAFKVTDLVSDNYVSYLLQLDQKLPNGESLSASLELRFSPDAQPGDSLGSDSEGVSSAHEWNLVVPRGRVRGEIHLNGDKYEFDGTGYHDHNTGLEPLKNSFREWYWGRYHMEESTLIYYLMRGEPGMQEGELGWENKAWLIGKDGALLADQLTCRLEDKGYNRFGLLSARKIIFESESGEWLIQKNKLIDDGPFYQRFEGRVMGTHEGNLTQGQGFSEYIKPSRIYTKAFWPLVNMRITYPGKPHWVQKSKRLHRWTWRRP